MSTYTPATNFAAKDALTTGNPAKIVKGTEISAEFNAISTAVNSKVDTTKFPNVSTAVTKTSAELNKVLTQDGTEIWLAVSGTDTLTATATPTVAAYVTGQTFRFMPVNSNTGAVTINIDGLGAKSVTKSGSTALSAGDIAAGVPIQITYDGTRFQLFMSASGSYAQAGANNDITSLSALTSISGQGNALLVNSATTSKPIVRQTVLSGTVDANGFPSFGGSTGSTTVTASATIVATAANGFAIGGAVDYTGSITSPSWTGLSTNGTMYLYLDIAANGTCTTGSTTLAPIYQFGGTYSTTANRFTFNIQEMVGKVGNGSTAVQTYRVFVGEVTVSAGVVSAIVWYALMGRYDSGYINTIIGANSSVSKNHNIGMPPVDVRVLIKNLTTEGGYAVGDEVEAFVSYTTAGGSYHPPEKVRTRLACGYSTEVTGVVLTPKAGGSAVSLTAANWAYRILANRGW